MAYVSRFSHDIFISYAHADDEPDPQGVQWVSDFQLYLKRAVKQHLAGYDPEVFFDSLDLKPNHMIDSVLTNVRRSAVFLPIISPSYVERPWPNDELQAFSAAVSERDRIFAVELLPPIGDYPAALRHLKRKQFWWRDQKQGSAPRKFTPKAEARTYMEYLEDIAYLIAGRLREMNESGGQEAASSPGAGKTVLLAEVTDDLRQVRRRVREYLQQFEFNVLPKEDYPEAGADFVAAFTSDLAKADVYVHLLSEVRSIRAGDLGTGADGKSVGQFQYDAAMRRGIPVLQWRSPDLDVSSVTHWDHSLLSGPQVLTMGLQEFLREIKKTLDRPVDMPKRPQGKGELLFINADKSDKEFADELLKMFDNNPEWMAMEPLFEGTADEILEDLEANLKDCAALVLVYGKSGPPWVRAQLRRYAKLARDKPPRKQTIVLGPPAPKSDRDLGSAGGFTWLDCQNGISKDDLRRIVTELSG
ncbi:MAG: hypothetical protein QOI05_2643 [Bradyrhizobium sp.]|jgi:hypothetical protein|nr:hypothetical protein [Bradyrhizobium sp.]